MLRILSAEQINLLVDSCARRINSDLSGVKNLTIVAVLKGAVYFFVDLTRKITIPHSQLFIAASSYNDEQKQSQLKIQTEIPRNKIEGKTVLLVDELFDTGLTINLIKEYIESLGADKVYTCTAFVKNKTMKPDYYGLNTPDVWLVGYGLDDCEKNRNLIDLYAVPKHPDIEKNEDDKIFVDQQKYEMMLAKLAAELNYGGI